MQIGQRIRQLREERRLSIADLAASAGIDVGNLERAERGEGQLHHDELVALATALGIEVDVFFQEPPVSAEPEQSLLIPASKLSELLDQMKE